MILDGEAEYRDSEGNHVRPAPERHCCSLPSRVSAIATQSQQRQTVNANAALAGCLPQRENPLIQKLALNMGKQQLTPRQRAQWVACNCASKCGCTYRARQRRKCEFPVAWTTRVLQSIHGKFHALTHHEEKAALTAVMGRLFVTRLTLRWLPIPTARFADRFACLVVFTGR